MLNSELKAIFRKYWYIFAILVLVVAGLVYAVRHYDLDPTAMIEKYKTAVYYIILVWTFLEGETIVIIAGMLTPKYGFNPWLIALCAFGGSFISDQVMFSLGKYKGEAVLRYFPRLARNVDKAARLFKKYDTALILGFRFVYGVRNVTPILLGISGVSHKKFFALNIIGAGVWALTFTFGGLYSGKAFMHIMEQVGHGILYVILGIIVLAGGIWYLRARRSVKEVKEIAQHGQEIAAQKANNPSDSSGDDAGASR